MTAHETPGEDPVEVGHLRADLGRRSVRGGLYGLASRLVRTGVQIASMAVLARLLTPEEFGLFAWVTAATAFLGLMSDFGLSPATVQRETLTREQADGLFWINAALGGALALAMTAMGPVLAWAFDKPEVPALAAALAPNLLLGGVTVQHLAILQRRMRFGKLAWIETAALVAAIAASIGTAWAGWGVWALVARSLVESAGRLAGAWWLTGWRPGRPRRRIGMWSLVVQGGWLSAFGFLTYVTRYLDDFLIGWRWGDRSLGHYSRAYYLLTSPLTLVVDPISGVATSALSRLQSDPARYARLYRRVLRLVYLAILPMGAVLFVAPEAVVGVLLGDQWDETVPVLRWLAIALVCQPLGSSMSWVYLSTGRTRRLFRWGVLSSPVVVAGFLAGLPYGPEGVALAYSISNFVLVLPMLRLAFRDTPLRVRDVAATLWDALLATVAAGFAAWAAGAALADAGPFLRLLAGIAASLAGFWLCLVLVPGRLADLRDLVRTVRDLAARSPVPSAGGPSTG